MKSLQSISYKLNYLLHFNDFRGKTFSQFFNIFKSDKDIEFN